MASVRPTTTQPCPTCKKSDKIVFTFSGSCGFLECMHCWTSGPCDDRAADPHCEVEPAYEVWDKRSPTGCVFCGSENLYEHSGMKCCAECEARWPA